MKFATQVACISVVLCTLAATALGQSQQLLLNTSFDTNTDNWTLSGGLARGSGTLAEFWKPRSGNGFLLKYSNYTCNWGTAEQEVMVTTEGDYNLGLSFWAYVRATDYRPTWVAGELLINGQTVAAAVKSVWGTTDTYTVSDYYQTGYAAEPIWATWRGSLSTGDKIKVRLTVLVDGAGYSTWASAVVDDVQLFSSACTGQPDVTDTSPNAVSLGTTSVPLVLTGNNLTTVDRVRLRAAGTRGNGNDRLNQAGLIKSATSLTATFNLTDLPAGVYDVIAEPATSSSGVPTDCNPVVIARGFQILDTAAEQNLLGNASFEVVNETITGSGGDDTKTYTRSGAVGSAAMWFGDYLKDPAMVPGPNFIDWGDYYFGLWGTWSNSKGEPGTEPTNTWQTVAVEPGSTVYFEGWLDCNAVPDSTSDATVNVWDGDIGGTLIGTASIDETTPGTEPENPLTGSWVKVVITGTSNSGYVTVQFTTQLMTAAWGKPGGVFADAFKLTASPICSDPLNPWIAYPTSAKSNTDPTVTITGGSNLDEVSAVSLVRLTNRASQPDSVVPGTVLSQTPTRLVVSFPLQRDDHPTGIYNIVLEKPSSPPANLAFYRIQPRTRGTGLPPRYHPNVPATFANGFSFQPLLLNGDFEAEGKHTSKDVSITIGWTSLGVTNPVYNGSTHHPPDDDNPPWGYNKETDNRGSVSEGSASSNARIVQEGIPVRPNYGLTLTGWIYGGSNGGPYFHQVLIHDGDANGNIIGQYQLPNAGGGGGTQTGWQAVSIVDAMPTQSTVTVEWGHTPNGSTTYGTVTTHVDQLLLVQEKATCSPIFADADNDGDVDQIDFAAFQECFTGDEGIMPTGTRYDCGCFDVAGATPNLITQADLTVFERCATGPGIPAAYDCADQP